VIGVDRLDYSKGLIQRLDAFDIFLANHNEWLGKLTYLQITPTNRAEIPEYSELQQALESAAGRINGKYGEVSWTPIRYVNRVYSRSMLAGLYRTARVGLVTPLRDGMNLVAKEYVAAQDPDDPGVLILSRFAGAASISGAPCWSIPMMRNRSLARLRRHSSCRLRKDAPGTKRCTPKFANTTSIAGNENS
jgi:trehalose 6-phosphate synthase